MTDLCIFAHYDRDGVVDPYVMHYLEAIQDCGFEIVFVSTVSLGVDDTVRLRKCCSDVILRDNVGHDFGSWAVGLERHRSRAQGRLLLANDSVYGPIASLPEALERLTATPADFFGMILSHEITPHLQSWFLLFEPHVVTSSAFADIFCQPVTNRQRDEVILDFELRATAHLQEAGYKCRSLFDSGERRIIGNPTVYLWQELVELDGIPFLKVAVLRDDPGWTAQDWKWRPYLQQKNMCLFVLVNDHHRRTLGRVQVGSNRRNIPQPLLRGYARLRHYSIAMDDRFVRQARPLMLWINAFILGGLAKILKLSFDFGASVAQRISKLLQ